MQDRARLSKQQPDPRTAAARLTRLSPLRPTLAMVLGSGFHHVLSELQVQAEISYAKLPGFPRTAVSGHAGQLFIGHLGGAPSSKQPDDRPRGVCCPTQKSGRANHRKNQTNTQLVVCS